MGSAYLGRVTLLFGVDALIGVFLTSNPVLAFGILLICGLSDSYR